jgi:hypothetical protein
MNLILMIDGAFRGREKPSRAVRPDHPKTIEYEDALKLSHRTWQALTGEEMDACSDAVYGLSPAAFCYFLPGWMSVGVREERADFLIYSTLVAMLDRSPVVSTWDGFFLDRWPLLTDAECAVTQQWVLWLSEFDGTAFTQDSLTRSYETLELLRTERAAFEKFRMQALLEK